MRRNRQNQRNIRQIQAALEIKQNYQSAELAKETNKNKKAQVVNKHKNLQIKDLNIEELLKDKKEQSNNFLERKMGYKKLEELCSKDPSEILLALNSPKSGFIKLLKENSISNDMMSNIIIALGKTSKAKETANLSSLINQVAFQTPFLNRHLQCYLIKYFSLSVATINSILQFLKKFQEFQPVASSEILTFLIPSLENALEKFKRRGLSVPSIIKNSIESLKEKKDGVIKQYDEKARYRISSDEKLHSEMPPEDYKTIPIFPTKDDFVNKRPFLRPNIVKGNYFSVNHYLDVQFRLLREDYVRPLRENLESYKQSSNQKGAEKKFRVYNNVQVLCPYNTEGGIVHLISFDVKPFSRVQWEVSKRLLTGSLLCFSSDNFETMKFATVANRDPSKLRKGQLEVHFEKLGCDMFSIPSSEIFVMVESEAYFEAFRHTLLALQQINEENLPLKQYIVHVANEVNAPMYLNPTREYNFLSTFRSLYSANNKGMVPVLDRNRWPSKEILGLDASQYSAIQAALTKEMAIIQGPPGTGKTFIGLKISQLLLENSSVWNKEKNCPILVVCYTNHALDQFLEGMLSFESNIIRIGGRSNNERIKMLQLSQVRQNARQDRKIPYHIYLTRRETMKKIAKIQRYLDDIQVLLENSTQEILNILQLQNFIERRHVYFLQSGPIPSLRQMYSISDWLEISSVKFENLELDDDDDKNINDDNTECTSTQNENVDGEEDIEFELGLREIDEYEFKPIDYLFPTQRQPLFRIVQSKKTERRKKRRYISKQLRHNDIMTFSEVKEIGNVWKLEREDRWRLYRFWVANYIISYMQIYSYFEKSYQEQLEKLQELRMAEDKSLVHQANIIGMTTTGAGKYHELLQDLQPCIVIVEEAAEVLEAHIVTSLTENTKHLILIGDHQQLRPSPTVYELAVRYSLDVSLFERMIKNGMPYHQLMLQHRMRPCIAKLLTPSIYPNLQNDNSVEKYENILGVGSNMFFINHCHHESDVVDTRSHSNIHEAKFLVELCLFFKLQGYKSSQITVLTTYSGQLFTLKRLMKGNEQLNDIRVTVVDNFQGEENDIIIISFVRSNEEGSIGFLKTSNRVCVALSRAKKGLFCIGNFQLLAEKSVLWKNITKELEQQSAIGTSLSLNCQNHPEYVVNVSEPDDFKKKLPDGGCVKPCNFRMECGHSCTRTCHAFDREHTELKCKKPCKQLLCSLGHECQKLCYEKCGKCTVPTKKIIPSCQHENLVPCHVEAENFPCKHKCDKVLNCGHICLKSCSQSCDPCTTKIEKAFDCGHKINVLCHKADSVNICNKECGRSLLCGHECKKSCGITPCPPCETLTKITLSCNHQIKIKCHEYELKQFSCEQACGKNMACGHECKMMCSHQGLCESCDEKCNKVLECGHLCSLKCEETCPVMCKTCEVINKINQSINLLPFKHGNFDRYNEYESDSDDSWN
ncbi:NFX1-type zinc finger-containing protein 1-like isoform X2 [Centruroides vittatus]|uniref:NFX1-type zinc finger-containing protein 1-like isoform X2 n=1 Tax=Centruroides vittatus TaxID=120091 RepID=UPI00350FB53B